MGWKHLKPHPIPTSTPSTIPGCSSFSLGTLPKEKKPSKEGRSFPVGAENATEFPILVLGRNSPQILCWEQGGLERRRENVLSHPTGRSDGLGLELWQQNLPELRRDGGDDVDEPRLCRQPVLGRGPGLQPGAKNNPKITKNSPKITKTSPKITKNSPWSSSLTHRAKPGSPGRNIKEQMDEECWEIPKRNSKSFYFLCVSLLNFNCLISI